MEKLISVVIPNYNGGRTIGKCLEAAFSSVHENFEVIVVDDCSADDSIEIIRQFPCKLIRLERRSGASAARNAGARNSRGEILFFIDADCILKEDALSIAAETFEGYENTVLGGTYADVAYDDTFFSTFQAVFVNFYETKYEEPDYIASHAMIIARELFMGSGGFTEDFLPIIEDVEFSHRLRRSGVKLRMNPAILVRHIFNFTLKRSLQNAFRKTRYWVIYSLSNRDVFKDSGTASVELKTNVISCFFIMLLALLFFLMKKEALLLPAPLILSFNAFVNRNFIFSFFRARGPFFAVLATLYYFMVYSLAVGTGTLSGMVEYYFTYKHKMG